MTSKHFCKTCKHCVAGQASLFSMCKVRRIKIHPEISIFAFCHHWSKKEPVLPIVNQELNDPKSEKQLDFGKVLVSTES